MKRYVSINLGNKERKLLLNMGAIRLFEETTGKSYFTLLRTAADMKVSEAIPLLWACMKDEDKDITLEQVEKMMTRDKLTDVYIKLGEVMFRRNLPESSEKESPNE